MCGIVGIISRRKNGFWNIHADIFTRMLEFNSIRGEDSTGMFGVNSRGEVEILKGDADGYLFTHSSEYAKMAKKIISSYNIVIGHNRKATAGAVTPENAHPFQEGRIVVVHNGVVRNFDKFKKDITDASEVEVDSHALAHLLAKQDAQGALEQINGAFALVWYDSESETLNLARNDERPLGLIEYDDMWIISSEFGLPLWLNRREQRKEIKCSTVPTDKILMWHLDELNNSPKELKWDEYAAYRRPEPPKKSEWHPPAPLVTREPSASMSTWPRQNIPMFPHRAANAEERKLHLVHQDRITNTNLKEGQTITFSFDDDKETQHGGWEVIGSLVTDDGVKDQNVIVRWAMPRIEFDNRQSQLATYSFFTGRIRAVGTMQGCPVVYVEAVNPIKLVRSFDGSIHSLDEKLREIMKKGCGRCGIPIIDADIERTMLRKRENGDGYRTLCHECLADSIAKAEMNKAQAAKAAENLQPPTH